MSSVRPTLDALREKIISEPDFILQDQDVMNALIAANERAKGENVIDLRSIAMGRLENRLGTLEDTHRTVIAAAYDNMAGTTMIQNAVLRLMDPADFEAFLMLLSEELPELMRVERMRLVLESEDYERAPKGFEKVLSVCAPGAIEQYITLGHNRTARAVTLREVAPASQRIYGPQADLIRSEALLRLDLGRGCKPALLILGSTEPGQFHPTQGTDLLAYFGAAYQRLLQRWLA